MNQMIRMFVMRSSAYCCKSNASSLSLLLLSPKCHCFPWTNISLFKMKDHSIKGFSIRNFADGCFKFMTEAVKRRMFLAFSWYRINRAVMWIIMSFVMLSPATRVPMSHTMSPMREEDTGPGLISIIIKLWNQHTKSMIKDQRMIFHSIKSVLRPLES